MKPIEIARRMAQLGETQEALRAYALTLNGDAAPREHLEAAAYLLNNKGDYKLAYTAFVQLYNAGHCRGEILPLMQKAFLEPNIKLLKTRYERNRKQLEKYPYFFHEGFLDFDELPLVFYPFDDHNGYVPYDTREEKFRGFVNVKNTVVSRNFFRDLEKPILASDVYSQYELEYLNDNVRPSEWVARENHIYLHYTDWAEFCSYLTVLNVKPLVESRKVVFLIGDELSQYPIDFKERFGIDYSQNKVEPFHVSEINKVIWHTQLSSDNGGDFFNEVFDNHPNLLCLPSLMYDEAMDSVEGLRETLRTFRTEAEAQQTFKKWNMPSLVRDLFYLKAPTDKDLIVAFFFRELRDLKGFDRNSRIAPAFFFQPHFHNIRPELGTDKDGNLVLNSDVQMEIEKSKILRGFKYVKTFTPVRRFTTSYAATIRYMMRRIRGEIGERPENAAIGNTIVERVTNRCYLRDPDQRLYRDAVVVRFEDGKTNPRATFSKLAEFLDIPYTESMTYCSENGVHDVETAQGNAIGFDTRTVYATYDEFTNDAERSYIEYFLRDAYRLYGYDFQYYDGTPVDDKRVADWVRGFTTLDNYMRESYIHAFSGNIKLHLESTGEDGVTNVETTEDLAKIADMFMVDRKEKQYAVGQTLLKDLRFLNKNGQPMEPIPWLKPDPDLLDQPLYH